MSESSTEGTATGDSGPDAPVEASPTAEQGTGADDQGATVADSDSNAPGDAGSIPADAAPSGDGPTPDPTSASSVDATSESPSSPSSDQADEPASTTSGGDASVDPTAGASTPDDGSAATPTSDPATGSTGSDDGTTPGAGDGSDPYADSNLGAEGSGDSEDDPQPIDENGDIGDGVGTVAGQSVPIWDESTHGPIPDSKRSRYLVKNSTPDVEVDVIVEEDGGSDESTPETGETMADAEQRLQQDVDDIEKIAERDSGQ